MICPIHHTHFGRGFAGRGRRRCYECERTRPMIPEDCTLVAIDTGHGYQLEVRDGDHMLAILAWPESWPEIVSPSHLTVAGFKILPA